MERQIHQRVHGGADRKKVKRNETKAKRNGTGAKNRAKGNEVKAKKTAKGKTCGSASRRGSH